MSLHAPDLSRGHPPLLGLFLANPGARLTRDEIWDALRDPRVSPKLGNAVRRGVLLLDGEHYTAPTPFPLSTSERDKERKKAVRRARGLRRQPPALDHGEVSEEARKARQQATVNRRLTGRAKIQAKVADLLAQDASREWFEKDLLPLIGGSPILAREALIDMVQNGQVHASVVPRDKSSVYLYRAVQVADPARAPAKITPRYAQIHALVVRERAITRERLLEKLSRVTGQPARTLNYLVNDLFHGGYLTFRPVCATVVIQPGPTALPDTNTPMPLQEADAA